MWLHKDVFVTVSSTETNWSCLFPFKASVCNHCQTWNVNFVDAEVKTTKWQLWRRLVVHRLFFGASYHCCLVLKSSTKRCTISQPCVGIKYWFHSFWWMFSPYWAFPCFTDATVLVQDIMSLCRVHLLCNTVGWVHDCILNTKMVLLTLWSGWYSFFVGDAPLGSLLIFGS